jgi:DnaJ-class molecular chaperone
MSSISLLESASQEEMFAAYCQPMWEYRPDRLLGIPGRLKRFRKAAKEKWHEIQQAWSVLGDPDKRRQYDEALSALRCQSRSASEP